MAVFPIVGPESPARLRRQALEQIAAMPTADGVDFHGEWSWTVARGSDGRTKYLVARIRATSSRPAGEAAAEAADLADACRGPLPGLAAWIDGALAGAARLEGGPP